MEMSKQFYYDVLDLNIVSDFGANVMLTSGLSLQTDSWKILIHKHKNVIIFMSRKQLLGVSE